MLFINKQGGTVWRKQKVLGIIVSSQVYSVSEISKLSGIREKSLIPTIRYLISHANTDFDRSGQVSLLSGAEVLRGARFDLNKMEIILAKVNSIVSVREEPKWVCPYCRAKNPGEEFGCGGCGARRQA